MTTDSRNLMYQSLGGSNVFVPCCVQCDKPTRVAPCENCGKENPIGTKEEARDALNRRAHTEAQDFIESLLNYYEDHAEGFENEDWHSGEAPIRWRDRLALMLLGVHFADHGDLSK